MTDFEWGEENGERAYIPTHDDEACHGWGTRSFWADEGEQATAKANTEILASPE
jgi:hypothetical protein